MIEEKDAKEIVQQFIELSLKMDSTLMVRMKHYAERLGIPLWLVIQNILISDFARKTARIMVEGASPNRELPEFVKSVFEDGIKEIKTGDDLFKYLVEIYKREYAK